MFHIKLTTVLLISKKKKKKEGMCLFTCFPPEGIQRADSYTTAPIELKSKFNALLTTSEQISSRNATGDLKKTQTFQLQGNLLSATMA